MLFGNKLWVFDMQFDDYFIGLEDYIEKWDWREFLKNKNALTPTIPVIIPAEPKLMLFYPSTRAWGEMRLYYVVDLSTLNINSLEELDFQNFSAQFPYSEETRAMMKNLATYFAANEFIEKQGIFQPNFDSKYVFPRLFLRASSEDLTVGKDYAFAQEMPDSLVLGLVPYKHGNMDRAYDQLPPAIFPELDPKRPYDSPFN